MKPVYYENGALKMLDQTLLPTEEVTHSYTDYREIATAIVDMIVRGAPAIGVTAGYGVYFGALEFKELPREAFLKEMETVCQAPGNTANCGQSVLGSGPDGRRDRKQRGKNTGRDHSASKNRGRCHLQ